MKKVSTLILLFVLAINSALGSPLVFKANIEIKTGLIAELGTLDTSKYKQIRLLIKNEREKPQTISEAENYKFYANVYIIEDNQELLISSKQVYADSVYQDVIDTPPSKLKIKVTGQGKFQLYIWASQ